MDPAEPQLAAASSKDYWKVWNYKYLGRKRPVLAPVRDDAGILLRAVVARGAGTVRGKRKGVQLESSTGSSTGGQSLLQR